MPLEQLIAANHPNLKEINSVNQLPTKDAFIATVGAPWCGHCKQEFQEVLNPLCNEKSFKGKGSKCFGIDGTSEAGQKFVQDIGLPIKGYPTTVMCKPNDKQGMDCLPLEGAHPRATLEGIAKKMGMM